MEREESSKPNIASLSHTPLDSELRGKKKKQKTPTGIEKGLNETGLTIWWVKPWSNKIKVKLHCNK